LQLGQDRLQALLRVHMLRGDAPQGRNAPAIFRTPIPAEAE
jgi:hypothetical protein